MDILKTEQDLDAALQHEGNKPFIVFKHSTQCPISAAAHRAVEQFEAATGTPVYMIRVIEEKPLSNAFADRYRIPHASPQAIAFRDGRAVWNTSHYDITESSLKAAVQK